MRKIHFLREKYRLFLSLIQCGKYGSPTKNPQTTKSAKGMLPRGFLYFVGEIINVWVYAFSALDTLLVWLPRFVVI